MLILRVMDCFGCEIVVDGIVGCLVMEVICDNGFDELIVFCGGCCFCVICYVYVDEVWIGFFFVIMDDENDFFDSLDDW